MAACIARAGCRGLSRGPGSLAASTSPCLVALTRNFHASVASTRGTKNLDWFVKAVRRLDEEKAAVAPPVFPPETLHSRKRARAYLDLKVGTDAPAGASALSTAPVHRIVVELADDIVPTAVHNFLTLCQRPAGQGYVGSEVFKSQKGFAVFLGDWLEGNGRGSTSSFAKDDGHGGIVGRYFPSENFIGRHSVPGVLGMANAGVHSNGSVFYITLAPAPHLDGTSVAFGRVLQGLEHVAKIGQGYTTGAGQKPSVPVTVVAAGQITEGSPEWAAVDKALAKASAPAAKPAPAGKVDKKGEGRAGAAPASAAAAPAAAAPAKEKGEKKAKAAPAADKKEAAAAQASA